MRQAYNNCPTLDCLAVDQVELNLQCRDEIVPILRALQHLYGDKAACQTIFDLIAGDVNGKTNPHLGRPGLDYWQILVLAAVRLGCNLDYDKLQDLAENHRKLRLILGIGSWDDYTVFDWRQIRENITMLQPETIRKISAVIVTQGHQLEPDAIQKVRVDAFVVETNIHYPTESSLLDDGLRKIIPLAFQLALLLGIDGWRQKEHLLKRVHQLAVRVSKASRSKAKDKTERVRQAYGPLLDLADTLLTRARALEQYAAIPAAVASLEAQALHQQLKRYLEPTEKVLNTATRRIVRGESVPNQEKIFSIHEPHTELIRRGKAATPIQYGRNVLVVEDTLGFLCDYRIVPRNTHEKEIVVDVLKDLQERHDGAIREASFDCGFHSPENQEALAKIIDHPCLPVLGVPAKKPGVRFRKARKRHPGVESAIGALQSGNGQKRSRDHTEVGYERYVALGILGRNLHVLGKLLLADEAPTSNAAFTKRKTG